ncbi:hypothetical protein LSTR_LSTR016148 [Laodelphax striatellus]|uniref:Uncharacterized protein n=1 Tax=Laodelphax striatellus TaxID=195883 RepID=A0A482WGL7_LAOST|nr:hypothetical protein LSTR_LSTR016148 [Laodelphax striatellus]
MDHRLRRDSVSSVGSSWSVQGEPQRNMEPQGTREPAVREPQGTAVREPQGTMVNDDVVYSFSSDGRSQSGRGEESWNIRGRSHRGGFPGGYGARGREDSWRYGPQQRGPSLQQVATQAMQQVAPQAMQQHMQPIVSILDIVC